MRLALLVFLVLTAAAAGAAPPERAPDLVRRAAGIWRSSPGRGEEARALLARAEALEPRSPEVWFEWAEAGYATGRFRDAVVGYETAWCRGYRATESRAGLARALFRLGAELLRDREERKPKVLAIFVRDRALIEEIVADETTEPAEQERFQRLEVSCLMHLGTVRQWIGDLPEATEIFESLAERFPESHVHRMNLARIYTTSLSWEDALTQVEKAIELNPDPRWLEPQALLGSIYSHLGHDERAEYQYALYLAEHPNEVSVLEQLSEHYQRNERFEASAEILRRVLELDPDRKRAYRKMGYALRRLGRDEEAEVYEATYRRLDAEAKDRRERRTGVKRD
jgi:tetratricopeptide (TPR) repeat protein